MSVSGDVIIKPKKKSGAQKRKERKAVGVWVPRAVRRKEILAKREAAAAEQASLGFPAIQAPAAYQPGTTVNPNAVVFPSYQTRAAKMLETPPKRKGFPAFQGVDPQIQKKRKQPSKKKNKQNNALEVGICLKGHPEKKMTTDQMKTLRALLNSFVRPMKKGMMPKTKNWRYQYGSIIVRCGNPQTKKWLEQSCQKIGIFEGSELVVKTADFTLNCIKIITRFPNTKKTVRFTLRKLEEQNPGVNCTSWKLIHTEVESLQFKKIVFLVSEEEVETLKRMGFVLMLNYGKIRELKIRFTVITKKKNLAVENHQIPAENYEIDEENYQFFEENYDEL
ncbi:uncharacterized protein LOC108252896 isoform X2 [Diaphorina citri]|uniref:Uncharacterized protein LOC108252896 isoform X2 n=1 Tax=Diaphorina citri TaxID=121845 RepID=A0A3Q0J1P8_DIACI|nr:uncharacterized protein LOC108252896 isoform X2 [Diaphorina citri]XP_026682382.1 uncharacterized protein LOC108252896 isoform X2 [Diaphorina citri]